MDRHFVLRARAVRAVLLVFVTLALAICPMTSRAWWKEDWTFRKRLDIDAGLPALASASGTTNVVVPVRLHAGNFGFFGDLEPDGSDLRFIAADDATPLDFRIERFDAALGLAVVWLRIPSAVLSQQQPHVWMYYGNAAAAALPDANIADATTVLSFDFAEPSGAPRDGTAYGTTARASTAQPAVAGLIDLGVAFAPTSTIVLPPSPALSFVPAQGFTLSAWIKPVAGAADGLLFTQSGANGRFEITAGATRLSAVLIVNDTPTRVEAALTPDAWHALGVTLGDRLTLYVDGREANSAPVAMMTLNGPALLGASNGRGGFSGTLDALRIANSARPAGWFRLEYELQRPESIAMAYGADESRTGGGWQKEIDLIRGLLRAVTIDGWIVIALIVALGLLSADVLLRKLRLLSVTERADHAFLAGFASRWKADSSALASGGAPTSGDGGAGDRETSVLGRLYRAALAEATTVPVAADGRHVTSESVELIRGALDATLVAESERLQRRLVMMTIAVSGGPFLGLLGTVVGVMITFAAVAASGDVNVNTIAPGIAAALFATVMGLLVAIPSLFGYNFIATRIAARIAAMEVFADQMVGRVHAALAARAARSPQVAHAA